MELNIPDGKSGEWSVETFTVQEKELSQMISMMKYGRGVSAGTYKRLMRSGVCVMSNTPDEMSDARGFIYHATGSILINGLGLGAILNELLLKPDITDITVVENSEDVIKLVAPYLTDSRLMIVHDDAFTYNPPKGKRYNAVWHDIWDSICSDNLPEMKKLHRKYGRRADYQESWARRECEYAAKRRW